MQSTLLKTLEHDKNILLKRIETEFPKGALKKSLEKSIAMAKSDADLKPILVVLDINILGFRI